MSSVLVSLYEEKVRPENPIDYSVSKLKSPNDVDVENLKSEINELKQQVIGYNTEIKDLNAELEKLRN